MFSNIGNKIRVFAKVIFFIGIGASAITGLIILIYGIAMVNSKYTATASAGVGVIFTGLFTAAIGAFYSWVFSLMVYGFGQLIHSTQRIEKQICGEDTESFATPAPNVPPVAPVAPVQPTGKVCGNCGYVNDNDSQFCVGCGKPL